MCTASQLVITHTHTYTHVHAQLYAYNYTFENIYVYNIHAHMYISIYISVLLVLLIRLEMHCRICTHTYTHRLCVKHICYIYVLKPNVWNKDDVKITVEDAEMDRDVNEWYFHRDGHIFGVSVSFLCTIKKKKNVACVRVLVAMAW